MRPVGYLVIALVALAAPMARAETAQEIVAAADKVRNPGAPFRSTSTLTEYIGAPLRTQQTAAELLALLAAVALLLAAIGLYGVIAYTVAQRSKEIGVRIALGARPSDVLRVVVAQAGVLLIGGLVVGLGGAAALGRIVSSLLFSVSSFDLAVFAAAAGTMVLIALAATGIPARKAMKIDPVVALRAE